VLDTLIHAISSRRLSTVKTHLRQVLLET
jgi:hypothetical protein